MEEREIEQKNRNVFENRKRTYIISCVICGCLIYSLVLFLDKEITPWNIIKNIIGLVIFSFTMVKASEHTYEKKKLYISNREIEAYFGKDVLDSFTKKSHRNRMINALHKMAEEDYEGALYILKRIRPKRSDRAAKGTIYYYMGLCKERKGDIKGAFLDYEEARKLRPGYVAALIHLASLYMRTQEFDLAMYYLTEAGAWDPENPDVYGSMGNWYFRKKKYQEAFEYTQKQVALDPESATAAANLCVVAHYAGHRGIAKKYFDKSDELGYEKLDGLKEILGDSYF